MVIACMPHTETVSHSSVLDALDMCHTSNC